MKTKDFAKQLQIIKSIKLHISVCLDAWFYTKESTYIWQQLSKVSPPPNLTFDISRKHTWKLSLYFVNLNYLWFVDHSKCWLKTYQYCDVHCSYYYCFYFYFCVIKVFIHSPDSRCWVTLYSRVFRQSSALLGFFYKVFPWVRSRCFMLNFHWLRGLLKVER